MRLLIDANLSPRVAEGLRSAGYDAGHVADLDMVTATDEQIFDRAVADDLVVVTADSDFGKLLALRRASNPSVIHVRGVAELAPGGPPVLRLRSPRRVRPEMNQAWLSPR